jgi:hypothetical protein
MEMNNQVVADSKVLKNPNRKCSDGMADERLPKLKAMSGCNNASDF